MKISEERILQISNDIAENMCKASQAELVQVVTYWNDVAVTALQKVENIKSRTLLTLLALHKEFQQDAQ